MSSRHKTIRQHYVWQYYLKPWLFDNRVNVWFRKDNEVKFLETKNLAVEKKFYNINKFSNYKFAFLTKFIERYSLSQHAKENRTYLNNIQNLHIKLEDKNLSDSDARKIRIEINNFGENQQSYIEKKAFPFLKLIFDNKYIENDAQESQAYYDFLKFIATQYVRTKNRKELMKKQFKKDNKYKSEIDKLNIDNCWNILQYVIARNFAYMLLKKSKLIICSSEGSLITSDQPVINLYQNEIDVTENSDKLALYFPLSPKIAVILVNKSDQKFDDYKYITREKVKYLNRFMFDNCNLFAFASSEDVLQNL